MENKPLNILVSCYACGPNWGSEVGMGWYWVMSISNHCKLAVITELGFKKDIEETLSSLDIKYTPDFYYIDIGERGRELFWKQGSVHFYKYYKNWQKKALKLAEDILEKRDFDIVHQLNMIGYREPGYLWKIKKLPYVFGPVGGYNQFPNAYFSLLNTRDKLFYFARNITNTFQMFFLPRPIKAYKKADFVILATPSGEEIVSKYTRNKPIIMSETGARRLTASQTVNRASSPKLVLTWVGIIVGRKALPIALKSIAKSKYRDDIVLNIVGDGPNEKSCRSLAKRLKLDTIVWHGNVSNTKAIEMIANSDMLFFTSVLEATSTVIFEALQSDTPVLCHDTCGFGNVIDETCGIKIPLINVSNSISMFTKYLDELIENPNKLSELKAGCKERIKGYYWDEKAKELYNIYKKCLE